MSFQRILETARRMGSPLIVTDAAGREPMVIMALQTYERLGEGVSQATSRKPQNSKPESEEPTVTEFATMAPQTSSEAPIKQESAPVLREIAIQVMDSPEMAQDSEISLEERFYLEPTDEETK
ncbi:hypothetical protein K8R04_00880 [Candidatus Uhrbacteria bacterium]|nr:hypothetical protein [Candidatus Uhrbacteria bacterium]